MTTSAIGNSIRQRLLTVSKSRGARLQDIETEFLIERLVARLVSETLLCDKLVFKGGFVGLKVYDSPRYTIDLDALLVKADLEKTLLQTRGCAELDIGDGVWFKFNRQVDLTTQGEYGGIRQAFRAGIGEKPRNIKKAKIINFDLGIGDPVIPSAVKTKTPMLLNNDELSWSVYPIETIIAEKLHAIVAHADANSRSKDVHDLALFLPRADRTKLNEALKACFDFRKTELPKSFSEILENLDTTILARGWKSAVASLKDPKSFESTYASLVLQIAALESR